MADHTVTAGAIGSPAFALTATAVSTVTFSDDVQSIEVISDGTAAVWWTCDGTTPAANVGYYIPIVGVDERQPPTSGNTVVKLWSTGTPTVRVQRGT